MKNKSRLSIALPVAVVLAALLALWYGAALPMNSGLPSFPQGGSLPERFLAAWALERPVLPAPHQIFAVLWTSTVETPLSSPRSLVFHGAITVSSTLLGFALGAVLGIALAIGIVHSRVLEASLVPWLVASQTIPILAIAPIVVVALGAVGVTGLVPKALISMYLSFFPVAIGMVKGLTSPEPMLLDLMRTYSAGRLQTLLRLRLPAALPFLFASLKVAVAISLVGAIVGELPTGGSAGIGARLLSGSYYGQTIQIWAALFAAAIIAAVLVQAVALAERLTGRAMGSAVVNALALDKPTARHDVLVPIGIAVVAFAFVGLIVLAHASPGAVPAAFWLATLAAWAASWWLNRRIAETAGGESSWRGLLPPVLFGAVLFALWEIVCVGAGVPFVLMPPPSAILTKLVAARAILLPDFVQTVLRSALPGWALGAASGFLVALACDRSPFLRKGLLPIADFVSALPIIGIAPIMVMWFGFDWQSKVAVVVAMTFFPMLVNTLAGLSASGQQERDLMRSYGADWATTLLRLRLPMALPFIFNALKINATLALIGAIVAEFFGTPTVGMGFRISTEIGRMGLDMVWAEIVVAALAGSLFYGGLSLLERLATFWHPSLRRR